MNVNIQKIMVTNETVRIIYPSKNPVFEGKRALSLSDTGAWRGNLSNDLGRKTLLADLINQQHDELFACNISARDKIRKIQAIDSDSLKLSEFFLGGQILLFVDKHKTVHRKIYLPDRIENFEYLGNLFHNKLLEFTNNLNTSEYGFEHVIMLSIDITI